MPMDDSKRSGLFVEDVLRECESTPDDEVCLKHPLAFGRVFGTENVLELASAAERALSTVRVEHSWTGPQMSARGWTSQFRGRTLVGVTAAIRSSSTVEVQILLGSYPAELREELRSTSAGLITSDALELPEGTDVALPVIDPNELLDAQLPFRLADDVTLTSPVAVKPIRGLADVDRVCGHTVRVYGTRVGGPRLTTGATTLSFWTGSVADLTLEVANVIHWKDRQSVDAMAMAMRPWPVVQLFQERMRARTLSFLDDSYFDSLQGG